MGVREGFTAAKLTTIIAAAAPTREVDEFAGWSSVAERDEEVLGCCSQWVSTCPFHHLFRGDHKFFFSKSVKNILPSIGDQMSDEGSKILN